MSAMAHLIPTYRGAVYPWHCDQMGHMNVMWYAGKFDEACWQLLSTLGLTRSRFREHGVGMVAIEQHIDYKRELHGGDIITIRSAVTEVRDKVLHLIHEMRNDETGEIAATTAIVALYIDAKVRKARSLPADVRARAQIMIDRDGGSDSEPPRQMTFAAGPSSFKKEPVGMMFI